jgi:hypothetical protein
LRAKLFRSSQGVLLTDAHRKPPGVFQDNSCKTVQCLVQLAGHRQAAWD